MVHTCWLDGSGAKWKPSGARYLVRSRLTTPGSTQAMRLSRSTSRIRFIRVSETTTGAPSGIAPPASPVPAPRGTTDRPCRAAILTIACTSPVEVGKQTGPATPPRKTDASRLSSERSAASTRTPSTPIAARTSAPPRTEHHCSQYDGDLVLLTVGSVRARPGQTLLIENAGMTRGAAEVTYPANVGINAAWACSRACP